MLFQPKRLLVTGGAGFIGANFIQYMLETYPDVHIINYDKLTYAACLDYLTPFADSPRYHFTKGDIVDQDVIADLLDKEKIDTIVHFAAESHVDRSIQDPSAFIQTNLVGTYALLEAARRVFLTKNKWDEKQCRFHHISTDEVFGSLKMTDAAFTEQTAYAPNSPYSASKAGSDHLVRAYQHTYQLPTTLSNCSNNYGPFQHAEKFIPTVINACLARKPIPIYNDGRNVRDWLYVVDHCRAIDLILRQGAVGETYNIGGQAERQNIEMVHLLCDLVSRALGCQKEVLTNLIQFVKDRPGHDFRYAIDCEKVETQLGWQRAYDLNAGLEATVKWYLRK